MCTNQRMIYNPYSKQKVMVKCGKCPACLQEKAALRSSRIRYACSPNTITLFVTLTYKPDFVPFIKRSELLSDSLSVNIYRNSSIRQVYSKFNGYSYKHIKKLVVLDSYVPDTNLRYDSSNSHLKSLRGGMPDDIGVCYYKDVQNFFKRLRQILIRNFNYNEKFSYFSCTEYGGVSQRPHIHTTIIIPSDDEATFRTAIVAAWPYADNSRTEKYIEIAKDVSNYVASYVNCGNLLPSALQDPFIKQKHSFTKSLGTSLPVFSLHSILNKIESGDLFFYRQQKFDGKSCFVPVPIPKYVISRYFPQFKGFHRLATSELFNLLLSPEISGNIFRDGLVTFNFSDKYRNSIYPIVSDFRNIIDYNYFYTSYESYRIYVALDNAYKRYYDITGRSRYDYALDYIRVWNLFQSTILKYSLENVTSFSDFNSYYLNLVEYEENLLQVAPTLENLENFEFNPNKIRDVVSSTSVLNSLYFKLNKQKQVTNYSMSSMDFNI